MKTGLSDSTLAAGVAVEDITPPLTVGLLMSAVEGRWAPFQSVRTPLKVRALVLESNAERIALVSLDLLLLDSHVVGGWTQFKGALAAAIPYPFQPDRIILACTHTHTAPDSSRTTNLYRTQPFRDWLGRVRAQIARAITAATANLQPCTLALASTQLAGFSLQRRVPLQGRIVMSDSLQPIAPELFERGPVDRRVHALWFQGENGATIATLVHAICHPVHEMCLPQVSADFPGELCTALATSPDNGLPLFFNGGAGDVNPPTVSCGAEAARRHGRALAQAVTRARPTAKTLAVDRLVFRSRTVQLPTRSLKGAPSSRTCLARLGALRLGPLAVALLPGELFTDIALAIEQASPFEQTLILGFAESSIGYVPTSRAFAEGGYEVGPGKWSFLQPAAEAILCTAAAGLLRELWQAQPAQIPKSASGNRGPKKRERRGVLV